MTRLVNQTLSINGAAAHISYINNAGICSAVTLTGADTLTDDAREMLEFAFIDGAADEAHMVSTLDADGDTGVSWFETVTPGELITAEWRIKLISTETLEV